MHAVHHVRHWVIGAHSRLVRPRLAARRSASRRRMTSSSGPEYSSLKTSRKCACSQECSQECVNRQATELHRDGRAS